MEIGENSGGEGQVAGLILTQRRLGPSDCWWRWSLQGMVIKLYCEEDEAHHLKAYSNIDVPVPSNRSHVCE